MCRDRYSILNYNHLFIYHYYLNTINAFYMLTIHHVFFKSIALTEGYIRGRCISVKGKIGKQ